MSYSTEDMTGYCGLYCGDCLRYNCKASELASQLDEELDIIQFNEYANVKKKSAPSFSSHSQLKPILAAISTMNCTTPCRAGGDGCSGGCTIIKCVQDNNREGCWECNEFTTCKQFEFLKPFHGDTNILNLKMIKKHGISNWLDYREKCYPWNEDLP